MKLLIKRTFCSACRRLVKGREQTNNNVIQVICSRCGKPIWYWNGIYWKPAQKSR